MYANFSIKINSFQRHKWVNIGMIDTDKQCNSKPEIFYFNYQLSFESGTTKFLNENTFTSVIVGS